MGKTDPHPLDQDFREDIVDAERVSPGLSLRELRDGFVKLLKPVASLRLTVVLFALSLVLVFCGTVAQKDASNWRVVNEYFRSFLVWIPLQTFVKFIQVFSIQVGSTTVGLSPNAEVPYSFPFPGGWAIGSLLMANLVAAHLVRFKLKWKRSGIVILHAGVGTLMVGELITGLYAIEGNMIIVTGQSSNYVAETNACELAVVDPSDAKEDEVTVVPASLLRKKGTLIQHEDLPFDIEVAQYMANSQMSKIPPSEKDNLATAGSGLTRLAVQVPEGSGVEKDQKVDTPSIFVTLKEKNSGQAIGTFLFSVWLGDQAVTVDGKKYEVSLRQKRHHKPYSLHLKKFDHDLYPGTEKAKNYSSLVQLVDPTRGENREFLISMNHPLRYGGETFYQSGVLENDAGTILQVVRNPGWILPYVACSMVSLGMLLHFCIHLVGFLRLNPNHVARSMVWRGVLYHSIPFLGLLHLFGFLRLRTIPPPEGQEMASLPRYLPWTIVGLGAAYLLVAMLPPHDPDGEMRVSDFTRLPVLEEGSRESAGRVKPYDSLARIYLMALSGNSDFKDENGDTQPAIKWLLDVMSSRVLHRRALRQNQLVKIEDPRVRELLGVAQRPDIIFAFSEFDRPHLQKLVEEAIRAEKVPETQRNDFDNHVLEVTGQIQHAIQFMQSDPEYNRKVQTYKVFKIDNDQVVELLGLKPRSGFRYSIDEFAGKMKPFMDRVKKIMEDMDKDNKKVLDLYDTKVMEVYRRLAVYDKVANLQSPWAVPPTDGKKTWQPLAFALEDAEAVGKEDPLASSLEKMLVAYAQNDAKTFNKELAGYRQQMSDLMPKETEKANIEFFLNHFDPFMQCMVLYGIVFLLACFSWVAWPETLGKAAFWLAALTLIVHSSALIGRMYLQDRYFVFVTNLYSSAIFIGWGCVVLGLVIESIFRNGIGIAAAAVLGFCSLFVARYLATTSNGETMEMLQAVLDTNFWLATHVTCVTYGYAATFFAGLLGTIYLLLGVFTRALNRDLAKTLSQITYGVVCFATLLSFTGTVLGGIWADQSWGRFWGWDPKENGAVLIVIWNALILHARWGGMVKQRGVAVLTIIGNMITGWSWFGTNQLGAGLHAYGFSEELALGLDLFWISQLIMLGIGLVPQRYWFSYETLNQTASRNPSATSGPKPKTKAALRH